MPNVPGNSLVVVEHWSLLEDGARGERCGDCSRGPEPNSLHKIVDICPLGNRDGMGLVVATHSDSWSPAHLTLAGDAVLLVEDKRHTL